MLITFHCRHCQAVLEASGSRAGTPIACPGCGAVLEVPAAGPGPGTRIGGFLIKELIGKGGMGEVYLAKQLSLGRDVALKILPRQLTNDKETVDRFLNEVRITARLEHPNIVTAHETGEDEGIYFLAMTLVRGEEMEEKLRRDGALPEKTALELVRKIAAALAYAWNEHRMLHRDIKPANIMLDRSGEPKLMDMGVSKSFGDRTNQLISTMVMGTPNYMSPEQVEGSDSLDFRTDLYSLGVTLHHMLTGRVPFEGISVMEVLRKQAADSLPDPRTVNPSVSEGCVALLEAMLAKNPAQRSGSWNEWLADADRVLAGKMPLHIIPAHEPSTLHRSHPAGKPAGEKHKIILHQADVHKLHPSPLAPHPSPKTAPKAVETHAGEQTKKKQEKPVALMAAVVGLLVLFVAILVLLKMNRDRSKPVVANSVALIAPTSAVMSTSAPSVAALERKLEELIANTEAKLYPHDNIPLFKALAAEAAGTPVQAMVEAEQKRLETTREQEKERRWTDVKSRASSLAAQGRYEEALKILDAIGSSFGGELNARRDALAATYKTQMASAGPRATPTQATAPDDLARGLVLYFSFDEPPTNSTVPDLSGQGNHGAATGVQWTASGKHNGAFVFGPSNSFIQVQNSRTLNSSNVSLSAWIQTSYAGDRWQRIVDKCFNKGFALSRGGASFEMRGKLVWENNTGPRCGSDTTITNGQWHHIASTFDGIESLIYVDGTAQTFRVRAGGPLATNEYPLTIGCNQTTATSGRSEWFNGYIDEMMIYNRALSPTEVRMLVDARQNFAQINAGKSKQNEANTAAGLTALADCLLRQDFAAVREKAGLSGGELAGNAEGSSIREVAVKVAGMQEVILASFKADIGKDVTVQLKTGAENLRIAGVAQNVIQAQRIIRAQGREAGFVERNFLLADTSLQEQFRRLGTEKTPEREIMRGLLAYQGKSVETAQNYFTQSGSRLGEMLNERIVSVREQAKAAQESAAQSAQESAAQSVYEAVLKVAGCSVSEPDVEKVRLGILRKKYSESEIGMIRKNLAAFRLAHGQTNLSKDRAPVLAALDKVIPDIPLSVDRETVDQAIQKLKAGNGGDLLCSVEVREDGIVLKLARNADLTDLTALAGLPIVSLDLRDTKVMNLKPLKGMPLTTLDIFNCPVWDLSPLHGLPITFLTAGFDPDTVKYDKKITDLSPLRGMPLETLHMTGGGGDLSPLKGMQLKDLAISRCGVSDLRPLRGMPLERFNLASATASDLTPLAGMPLKYFAYTFAVIPDLSGLKGLPVESVVLDQCRGELDLATLKGLPLKSLRFPSDRGLKIINRDALKDVPNLKIVDK